MARNLPQSQYPQRQWGDKSKRFGTAGRDPATGHLLHGERNQFGEPMGSSTGGQMSADTMTPQAAWDARFHQPRPGASSISSAPVAMGGTAEDGRALLRSTFPRPGGAPEAPGARAASDVATARSTGSAVTPYGSVAVNFPRPQSAGVVADLGAPPVGSGMPLGAPAAVSGAAGVTVPRPVLGAGGADTAASGSVGFPTPTSMVADGLKAAGSVIAKPFQMAGDAISDGVSALKSAFPQPTAGLSAGITSPDAMHAPLGSPMEKSIGGATTGASAVSGAMDLVKGAGAPAQGQQGGVAGSAAASFPRPGNGGMTPEADWRKKFSSTASPLADRPGQQY